MMNKNNFDFTLHAVKVKTKKNYKLLMANRYCKFKVDTSKIMGMIHVHGDLPVVFLTGATYLLLMYSLWFNNSYIQPSTPYEKVVTLAMSIVTYALVQFIMLEAFKAVGHQKKLEQMLIEDSKR